jgi:hypothetical protein
MVRVIVFNTIFNNISVISWRSVLLVEEAGIPGENHVLAASHWQIPSLIKVVVFDNLGCRIIVVRLID